MADGTSIEWTDMTWNPITGCSVVSPGCTNCYAMKLAGTRLKNLPSRAGLTRDTKAGPVWTGEVRFNEGWLDQPLRKRRPRMVFVCAHGDLFAEGVTDEMLDRVFAVIALAPHHTFQILTKRPERMRDYLRSRAFNWHAVWPDANPPGSLPMTRQMQRFFMQGIPGRPAETSFPLPNVWLGVSAEDQRRADERIPVLLDTPAAVRWVSAEPLLGPIDFTKVDHGGDAGWEEAMNALEAYPLLQALEDWGEDCAQTADRPRLDWIVAGGESGRGARPMHSDWVRAIRDQCAAAGVPFLFKQWGSWARAIPRPSGMPGRFAIASAGPHSSFMPAMVSITDHYPRQFDLFGGATVLEDIGKTAAGRHLDGVLHDAYPQCEEVLF